MKKTLKLKKEVEVTEVEADVQTPVTEGEENPYINEDEKEALTAQAEEKEAKSKEISVKKMASVVELVQNEFNLAEGNYVVNAFADKGNKSQISLSNEDFDIVITIKDNEKFGIM